MTLIGKIRNLPEPTKNAVRLVYRFYVNQYWEIRLPYVGRVCNIVGNKEQWISTCDVQ